VPRKINLANIKKEKREKKGKFKKIHSKKGKFKKKIIKINLK